MGLIELASGKSLWRGYDYFENNKVILSKKITDTTIKGLVSGSEQNHYEVFIDLEHPRKSKCNCPHADGKRIICKHMIALYFKSFPTIAKEFYKNVIERQEEEEKYQEELENKVIDHINSMTKDDLKETLYELLFNGPEWQYERFIQEYIL